MSQSAGTRSTYTGPAFRQAPPRYAEATERTLAGSEKAGGRFNPRDEFGVLYVSLDPETPLRELLREAARVELDILPLLPRTLFALEVKLQRVLDLTDGTVRSAWGLSSAELASSDWTACQSVARRAREAGYEAIRYPSASGAGENLAIFLDRLSPGSSVRIVNEDELRPDRW